MKYFNKYTGLIKSADLYLKQDYVKLSKQNEYHQRKIKHNYDVIKIFQTGIAKIKKENEELAIIAQAIAKEEENDN